MNATLGFGHQPGRPAISRFVARYPEVSVQLQLSVMPPPLTDDAFDVCIRFGEPPDTRVVARRLAPNRRLLCGARVSRAARHTGDAARPDAPQLHRHPAGDEGYGIWRLTSGRGAARHTEACASTAT